MLRIISGDLKGRRLETPGWEGLRPTSDRLRETLFNVLTPRIRGARVLDAYAGTGAVGLEALSRGAAHVTFVERDPRAVRLIRANLARCGVSDRYAIIRAAFGDAAGKLDGASLDIIVLDPPYGRGELETALGAASGLAAEGGVVVIEHSKRETPPAEAGRLRLARTLKAGGSALTFYTPRASVGDRDDQVGSSSRS